LIGLVVFFIGLRHQANPDVNPQTFSFLSRSVCYAQSEGVKTPEGVKSMVADSVRAVVDKETREVVALWQKYIAAVRANNDQQARSCWNTYEVNRYEKYNLFPGRQRYKSLTEIASDIVTSVVKEGDNLKLTVQWSNPSSLKLLITETKYCVKEGKQFVLANPLYVLKKDWKTYETQHIIYHHYSDYVFSPRNADAQEKSLMQLLKFLEIGLQKPIDYYIFPPNQKQYDPYGRGDYGRVLGVVEPWNSVALVFRKNSEYFPHEFVHVLQDSLRGKGLAHVCLREGLAAYFSGDEFTKPLLYHKMKEKLEDQHVFPLDSVVTDWRAGNDYYAIGAAVVEYLIETYGVDKFKQLYKQSLTVEDFKRSLTEIYGTTFDDLDREWRQVVLNSTFDGIQFGIRTNTKLICSLADPVGDDNGNGTYLYPQRDENGICDLTKVRIFEDKERVYFKLNLTRLRAQGDTAKVWRGMGILALDTTPSNDPSSSERVCFYPLFDPKARVSKDHAFEFEIHFSQNWIDLVNQRSEFLDCRFGSNDVKGLIDWADNSLNFSFPKSLVGQPNERWQIAVGIGVNMSSTKRPAFYSESFANWKTNFYDVLTLEGVDQKSLISNSEKKKREYVMPMLTLIKEK